MTLPKLTPARIIITVVALFVLYGVIVISVNWFQARGYDKARKQFEVEKTAWDKERVGHITRAEEAEKRAAALEPKAIAFDALAEQHKAADPALVKKIEEVSQNAANAEAKAEGPSDCATRARNICALLTTNKIKHDCGTVTRELCSIQ